ncbi:hypothetical protein [Pseudolactococcus reticulitermitis]|uniref:Uncharacterized protein n=1 Tax=Pseudolactococcus reticulitermitis TaxID=2025039 RepID=A0A224XBH6_9LACT|nr:hypothetical protein [Lactococcus reticulitermitis]GAX47282.1 hypothetical protein RsY01_881 [Lactococcus reticulitermitis]
MKIGNTEIKDNEPIGDVEVIVVSIQAETGKIYDFIMDTEQSNSPELGETVWVRSQGWPGRFVGIRLAVLKDAIGHKVTGILGQSDVIDKIVEEIG